MVLTDSWWLVDKECIQGKGEPLVVLNIEACLVNFIEYPVYLFSCGHVKSSWKVASSGSHR